MIKKTSFVLFVMNFFNGSNQFSTCMCLSRLRVEVEEGREGGAREREGEREGERESEREI